MKKLLRLISVATMLLAATTFMACSSDDDDDDSGARSVSARTSGSIVGVVLDNKGEPVEGATVTLGGKTAKTNYGGEFEITGVNPNDSKLISAAKTVTTTTTVSTVQDTSVANKPKTDTSMSTSSNTGNAAASTDISNTGYTLTVKKDGYLSGKVTGIFVRYQDTEDPEVTRANALLHGLEYDYQDILDRYAAALTNVTANNGTTATTTTTATEDTTATTTVQTGSNADRVFKDISEAISALKSLYKTGSYTEYFSDFATSSPLIPLDASLKGRIKLNLKTQGGSVYDANTYIPASKPTVHVSYSTVISPALEREEIQKDANGKITSTTTNKDGTSTQVIYNANGTTTTVKTKITATGADYTWEVKADANGEFVFDKSLPSGVPLKITVDSFFEKINDVEYTFSSESGVIVVENSKSYENSNIVTLGSKDANVESIVYMLFAQNDKIWVSETNVVDKLGTGVLLQTTDALTFTFNKAMKYIDFVADDQTANPKVDGTKDINLNKSEYTATWSEDKKTVTLKPNVGHWTIGSAPTIVLKGEAEDGATTFLNGTFKPYFDTKVWVSLKEDKVSYKDYNDYLKLSDPITLVFSKAMNDKVAVHLYKSYADNSKPENSSAYTESWSEDKTTLTLTPVAEAKYWDVSDKSLKIVVEKEFASSATTYNNDFGYWKTGAANLAGDSTKGVDCLEVYFDNYNDVTLTKASDSDSEFTVTFAKALKALTEKEIEENITIGFNTTYSTSEAKATGTSVVSDVKYTLDASHKVLTVKAQNKEFKNYGYYSIFFEDNVFVAETGEKNLRKAGTIDTVKADNKTPFVTTFTLGSEFKYTAVEVVDELPEGAIASRAIYVDNDKYLKITFNKEIRSSKLSIVENSTTTTSVTNYIKGNAVYLPLAKIGNDSAVKVSGTVLSTANEKWTLGTNGFDTLYAVNKLSYKMVKTSLYELKASIASGKNDAIVKKIAPGDTFTFEFDQDVSKAEWTAELYDENNVGVKNLDQTAYVATPAADGKVVTVTLSGKALDFGKVYYLSLKATKRTGDDAVVLYDSSVAKNNGSGTSQNDDSYGPLPDNSNATLNTGIMVFGNSNKPYIRVETVKKAAAFDNYYVVEESNNSASATTSFDEFKKSNKSKIVLEFSEDVTGFTAVLAKDNLFYNASETASSASNWLKAEDVLAKNTFASTAEASGKVITITPTDAFPSKSQVYPIVFTKDGDRLPLRKVSDDVDNKEATYLTVATAPATSRVYESAAITFDETTKKADKATNALFEATTTTTKLTVSNFDAANVGNGANIYFSFNPIVSANSDSPDYGTYTLYQKKQGINAASTVWKKVGEYKINGNLKAVDTTKSDKSADIAKGELQTPMVKSVEAASAELFAVSKLSACITAKADEDEFNYAANATDTKKDKKSYYRVVCNIDNREIYSNIIEITDAKVYADAVKNADVTTKLGEWDKDNVLTITSADYAAETAWADSTFIVKSTSYLKDVTVTLKRGDIAGNDNNSKNRVGKEATYKVEVVAASDTVPAHTQWTVKISPKEGASDASTIYVAAGDSIVINATDGAGKTTTYTIKFAKPN